MEFVNIGVVLFAPQDRSVRVRMSDDSRRIDRFFGKQEKAYLKVVRDSFAARLQSEFSSRWEKPQIERFADLRANDVRMSKPLPILVEEPEKDLADLFGFLVGVPKPSARLPKIASELKRRFAYAGIEPLVDIKPAPIDLPEGVRIEAQYGYQNGAYNLIDAVRLAGEPNEALAKASQRAVQGQWLWKESFGSGNGKRLVVVAEFDEQQENFVSAVSEMMRDHQVRLYDIKHLSPLIQDIRVNAGLHRS
jgi:hypothetical protein